MNLDHPRVIAGIKKYGSIEAYRQQMRERQKMSRINYKGTGGFAGMDKEKVKEISKKGVESRRKRVRED